MKKPQLKQVKTTGLGYPNIAVEDIPETREELYNSDRGEKEYFKSKQSLTEPVRLPITRTGVETFIDIIAKVAGIPNDDRTKARIYGHIHHLGETVNYTSIGEMVNVVLRDCTIDLTWQMDQELKEKKKLADEAKKAAETKVQEAKTITLAKDADAKAEGTTVHGT
jgi:hypothetical protein